VLQPVGTPLFEVAGRQATQSEDSADNRATDVEILDVSQMQLAAVKRGDATASGHADE
jgi:hypothetical protein